MEYYTQSQLKKRNWNLRLIEEFLKSPDKMERNPFYKKGSKMKLYEKERVEEIEKSDKFINIQTKREKNIKSAHKALETKRDKIKKYVKDIKVKVPKIKKVELVELACQHYNKWNNTEIDGNANKNFIQRICVNYLRHQLTKYEQYLDNISGKVGNKKAYIEIKTKVLKAIGHKYKWLKNECELQENLMIEKYEMGS